MKDFNYNLQLIVKQYIKNMDDRETLKNVATNIKSYLNDLETSKKVLETRKYKLEDTKQIAANVVKSTKSFYLKSLGFLISFCILVVFAIVGTFKYPRYFENILTILVAICLIASLAIFAISIAVDHKEFLARNDVILESALIEEKAKTIDKYCQDFTTLLEIVSSQIDLLMYKDIYKGVYSMQEWLKENDSQGFQAFVNAAKACQVDLSKYIAEEKVE